MNGRISERMNYPGNYFCRRFLNEEETVRHFSCNFPALKGRRMLILSIQSISSFRISEWCPTEKLFKIYQDRVP